MSEHPTGHVHPEVGRLGPPDPPGWADHPALAKALVPGLLVVCGLLILADLGYHKHGHYDFEEWVGFHGFYGFLSFVFLVQTSSLMRTVTWRQENYYDVALLLDEQLRERVIADQAAAALSDGADDEEDIYGDEEDSLHD